MSKGKGSKGKNLKGISKQGADKTKPAAATDKKKEYDMALALTQSQGPYKFYD